MTLSRASRASLAVLVCFSANGCYLSHGAPSGADAGPRAVDPRRDTGPTPRDAGARADAAVPLPPTIDASLPPLDEPDVDPDGRPSDDPGADDWLDPPAPSGDPCCVVGDVVGLDDPTHQASVPVVAWASDSWGVAWADSSAPGLPGEPDHALFVRLDGDARPLMPRRTITGVGYPTALVYAPGRFAVGLHRTGWPPSYDTYLGVLDRNGGLVDVTAVPEIVSAVARFPLAHAWVAATRDGRAGAETAPVRLRAYDDALDATGDALELGSNRADHTIGLASLKSRVVALRATDEGVMQTTVGSATLEPVSEGLVLRAGTYLDERGGPHVGAMLAAAALRNTVVVVAMDRTDVWSAVFDPFVGAVTAGPTRVATSPSYGPFGAGADDVGDPVGACYSDGAGPYGGYVNVMGEGRRAIRTGPPAPDRIVFALLGPDGTLIGEPVTVASDLHYVAACAVASAGLDHYVVVFWNADWDGPRHSILAARVDVRR